MKNIKLGHALRFSMQRKVFSLKKIKIFLDFSKAIGVLNRGFEPPYAYLVIDKFE